MLKVFLYMFFVKVWSHGIKHGNGIETYRRASIRKKKMKKKTKNQNFDFFNIWTYLVPMMPETCFRVPGYANIVFYVIFRGGLEPRRVAVQRFGGRTGTVLELINPGKCSKWEKHGSVIFLYNIDSAKLRHNILQNNSYFLPVNTIFTVNLLIILTDAHVIGGTPHDLSHYGHKQKEQR